jgi:hypothetical protein
LVLGLIHYLETLLDFKIYNQHLISHIFQRTSEFGGGFVNGKRW